MPTLGAPLDFAKLEGRNFRAHQLGAAPSSPVTGQLYYNTGDNTLYWFDGTSWISTKTPPDATPSTKGVIQLAGDLSGTAASPQIAAGVITDTEVAAANKDGAIGTPSMRTLGAGAQTAMPGDRVLNAINQPTGNLAMNNQKITGMADPTGSADAATKSYVDGVAAGLTWKKPVRVVALTNIGASPPGGPQTVDGVAVVTNDRVLLTAQTVPADNGIWAVNTGGTWARPTDADTSAELVGAAVLATEGTSSADTGWVCTTNAPITVGTTALTWVQFSGPGEYIGGAGLVLTGKTFDVGAGTGISVAADTVGIANGGVNTAQIAAGAINVGVGAGLVTGTLPISNGGTGNTTSKTARETGLGAAGYYNNGATHGAGTTITITAATHGLRASRGLIVQVQDNTTGAVELPDISVSAAGDVTITYAVAVSANSKMVTVVG
jgi:Repeat of unknown function (DUF5907)